MESRAVFFFFVAHFSTKPGCCPPPTKATWLQPRRVTCIWIFSLFFFWMRVVNYGELWWNCGELWHTYYTDMIYGDFSNQFFFHKLLVQISPVLFVIPFVAFRDACFFFPVRFCQLLRAFPPARLGIKNGDLLTVTVKARGVPEAWLQVSKNGW